MWTGRDRPQTAQGFREQRFLPLHLLQVFGGQATDEGVTLRRQPQIDTSAVPGGGHALRKARLGKAIDELNSGVMREQQFLRKILHRHGAIGPSLDRKKSLILLLSHARSPADRFTGGQEAPQRISECRQSPETLRIETH